MDSILAAYNGNKNTSMGRMSSPYSVEEVIAKVWKAVGTTINKFRKRPNYFFTESDIHAYLYHTLYTSRMEYQRDKQSKPVYLVHREYPTNFRYARASLLLPEFQPVPLGTGEGDRGNFDLSVLHPEFVIRSRIEEVINKDNGRTVARLQNDRKAASTLEPELLFAIELKYVIRNAQQFVAEVAQDNMKLRWAVGPEWRQARYAINLVFCNLPAKASVVEQVRNRVIEADQRVLAVFVHSDRDMPTSPPRAISNRREPNLPKVVRTTPAVHR